MIAAGHREAKRQKGSSAELSPREAIDKLVRAIANGDEIMLPGFDTAAGSAFAAYHNPNSVSGGQVLAVQDDQKPTDVSLI